MAKNKEKDVKKQDKKFDFDLKSKTQNNDESKENQEQDACEIDEISEIEKLELQNAELKSIAQRTQADFDNYRKRNATLRADSLKEGECDAIKPLLVVVDTFEIALSQKNDENPFSQGVVQVYKLLIETLQKSGLEEIAAAGEMFDPNIHDAVMQCEQEGFQSGQIIEVMQKGYKMHGKIIRYSMVKVAI